MSPKSRTRKPKSAGRNKARRTGPPGNPIAEVYRSVVQSFTVEADHTSSLHSELLASNLYSVMHETTNLGPGIDEQLFGEWARFVERQRDRPAAAMLWALAQVADPPANSQAAAAAQRLTDLGVPEPAWLAPLRKLEAAEAWMLTDVFGDSIEFVVEFRTGRRKHGMAITIDTNHLGGYATNIVFDHNARKLRQDRERFAKHMDPLMRFEPASLAEVRARGIAAIEATDVTEDPDVGPEYEEHRALALSRLLTLPGGDVVDLAEHRIPGPAEELARFEEDQGETEKLVGDFLASLEHDPAEPDSGLDAKFARLAELAIDYGRNYDDGRLLRVSPPKISTFAGWFLPHKVGLDDAEQAALAPFLSAWISWCGRRQGLPWMAVEMVQESAAATLDAVSLLEEDEEDDLPSPGMAFLEGVDVDSIEDAQAVMERRQFAMPYFGTWIGQEDYPRLNPNSAAELRLLVLGELKELHGVGKQEYPRSGEPDGSPVWNAALRELVISQLWHDEPPQVWEAAQRLLALGLEREDILDRLQEALSGHVDARELGPLPDGGISAVHLPGYVASLATLGASGGKGGHLRPV
ncbi:hypothetical protein SAMN04488693_1123 [Arthrobacter subterraneus]|uniref:Uncharacterized protein n=1 Tax=Arthrobacter subterraneus TaxID=335973 RepID=A0A1G8KS78_9MICC|nr:hypothetical protein [Arthrobacter subterraneus]SDI46229.1 hypothetical protein SAMN04488693_1123 [Arthrobacter subterraneus]